MKPILIVPIIITALTGVAPAAGYVMDLSGTAINQELVPDHFFRGIDGWEQSEANFGPAQPKAWISSVLTSTGIGFGPRFDDLSSDPFIIRRDTFLNMAGSSLSMRLELVEGLFIPEERNDFFIGLDHFFNFNLFTLNFVAHPDYNGGWLMNVNGMAIFGEVLESTPYDLSVSFHATGEDIEYSIDVVSFDNFHAGSFEGVITGGADGIIGNLDFGVTTGNFSANFGDNYMTVADVKLIPEPSTAILAALGCLGLLRRSRKIDLSH